MDNINIMVIMECDVTPRALTDLQKSHQEQRLLAKAEELALTYGVRRVSVEDIAKAAGMSKGSFYHHFDSKEELMIQLVWNIYQGFIEQAKATIEGSTKDDLRSDIAMFIRSIFHEPDKAFFFNNHEELESLILSLDSKELKDFNTLEQQAFAGLITLAGKDVSKVKPGVVHNYLHAMYFSLSDDAMNPEYQEETLNAMLEGLLNYIFGPEKSGKKRKTVAKTG